MKTVVHKREDIFFCLHKIITTLRYSELKKNKNKNNNSNSRKKGHVKYLDSEENKGETKIKTETNRKERRKEKNDSTPTYHKLFYHTKESKVKKIPKLIYLCVKANTY